MPNTGLPKTAGSDDSGWSRSTWTTFGAGATTPASSGAVPSTLKARKPVTGSSWSATGEVEPLRAMRSSEYFTSGEVTGRPLANAAPARSVKSQCCWSGVDFQLAARPGRTFSVRAS